MPAATHADHSQIGRARPLETEPAERALVDPLAVLAGEGDERHLVGQHEPRRRDGERERRAPGDGADGDGDDRHRGGDDDVENGPDLEVAPIGDEEGAGEAGDECGDCERRDRHECRTRTVCRRAANQPDSCSVTIAIAAPNESR